MDLERNKLYTQESTHVHSFSVDSGYNKDDIPLNNFDDKRGSSDFSTIKPESSSKKSFIKALFKPSINLLISTFLSIALMLLFLYADGKKIDYTVIGLRIPSLISLMLAIVKVFIGSGIGMAIAENKWIKLTNGADLTLIDVYDGCTRGLSGVTHLVRSMHFDSILVPALLFQFGLLAMSPLSQELLELKNVTVSIEDDNFSDSIVYSTNNLFYTDYSNNAISTRYPPKIRGVFPMSFIPTLAFSAAFSNYTSTPLFWCPDHADHCTFNNVSQITTSMTCENVTDAEIVHPNTGNVTTLSAIITQDSLASHKFPFAFYAGEMVNRTYEKLGNFTPPDMPGLGIPQDQASQTVYDPQYRPYVGDQVFIVAAPAVNLRTASIGKISDVYYQKCWFNSTLEYYNWVSEGVHMSRSGLNSSSPINMDYDRVIGNNTGLGDNLKANLLDQVMVNAYAIQQSLLYELVRPQYYKLSDYALQWSLMTYQDIIFSNVMKDALDMFNIQFIQFPFLVQSGGAQTAFNKHHGIATFILGPYYSINMTKAIIFSLALLIPTFWWIIVWIRSYKQTNGVLRGNSQIILLSADVSDMARKRLNGFANLDSSDAFAEAKKLRMRIGRYKDQADEVLVIGLHDEKQLKPL